MTEHILERRARMLADAIITRSNLIRDALVPPGTRPPFTKQLSEQDALAFWQRNRYTDIGRQVLERMKPESIMELDIALAKAGGEYGLQG